MTTSNCRGKTVLQQGRKKSGLAHGDPDKAEQSGALSLGTWTPLEASTPV